MKRRREQERDEEIAREQADARRDALLAELRAHQAGSNEPEAPAAAATPDVQAAPPDAEPADNESDADEPPGDGS